MAELEKILAGLRKDAEFSDCSEEELIEIAKMELNAKTDVRTVVEGDKRERKPRTPKDDNEKIALAEVIKQALSPQYPTTAIIKQGEIKVTNDITIKIIRHRNKG